MIEVGAGRQSQAEGRGRFMMRVMSAAPVVMDGSAEKATVPHSAARPWCAHRPPTELCTDSQTTSHENLTTNTPRATDTPTKGQETLGEEPATV